MRKVYVTMLSRLSLLWAWHVGGVCGDVYVCMEWGNGVRLARGRCVVMWNGEVNM